MFDNEYICNGRGVQKKMIVNSGAWHFSVRYDYQFKNDYLVGGGGGVAIVYPFKPIIKT